MSDEQYQYLQNVNAAVNQDHDYRTDKSGYGVGEHWAIMEPGQPGDCEDFALTKMQQLIDNGWDIKNLQIGWGYTENGTAHAFLLIQTSNRGTLVLDNRYPNVMQMTAIPYRFEAFQRAGQSWAGYTARLQAVAIEYMSCHAAAFADGDEVIIKFENQDWGQPKVIGFKSNPAACAGGIWIKTTAYYSPVIPDNGKCYTFDEISASFAAAAFYNDAANDESGVMTRGLNIFMVGGYRNTATHNYTTTEKNEKYNSIEDSWSYATDFPTDGYRFLSAEIEDAGFIIGGQRAIADHGGTVMLDQMRQYDFSGDSWASKSFDDLALRVAAAVWAIATSIYICGGVQISPSDVDNRQDANDIVAYDSVADSWSSFYDLPWAWELGAGFALNGKGYFSGGVTDTDLDGLQSIAINSGTGYYTKRTYEFNPVGKVLTRMADYPISADRSPTHSQAAIGESAGWFFDGANSNSDIVSAYSPTTDAWAQANYLPKVTIDSIEYYVDIWAGGSAKGMVN